MKKYPKNVMVYEFSNGYIIEVDKKDDCTEFYISNKDYGVKSLMFGLCDFYGLTEEEIVLSEAERHMKFYREEYEDYHEEED